MMSTTGREFTKTLLFVGAAVLTLFVAVKTKPTTKNTPKITSAEVNKPLFEELTDPSLVTGLEVLTFDEELGSLQPFAIKQAQEGEWIIPSKQGYPADARDRVAQAATMFIDRKVLAVAQDTDHERYGVVEPKLGTTKLGDEGVGTLFKVRGEGESELAELIIGNLVKNSTGQSMAPRYYVRRPGKSLVYTVEIDPTELSTQFTDWIDPTLLPFTLNDIVGLELHNYTTAVKNEALNVASNYVADISAKIDVDAVTPDSNSESASVTKWELNELQEFRQGGLRPTEIDTDKVLNQQRLNFLKAAIGAISIEDVRRKAKPLADRLRAGEAATMSDTGMIRHGYFPYTPPNQPSRIFASNGEIRINIRQGVQFQILIGEFADRSSAISDSSLKRYLMIVPQLYSAAFAKPELEEMPGEDVEMSDNDRKIAVNRIKQANDRKEKEYQERIEVAERNIQLLRDRYSDWYYLVSDDVVRKLRIPLSELIKLSEKSLKEGFGIEAFRYLQQEFQQLEGKK